MPRSIRHEAQSHRFVIDLEGATALLQYRELDAGTLDFCHTFVPVALRGGGIASQLTEHALRYARQRGYKVVPSCPFVAVYIERHPEYRDLLA
jgi:hypothetical protein